ncbi:MAG: AmiS/UreI family transporter [Bacillota bacterium]
MTTAILVLISLMWIPIALFFLGKGEARGTGFATAMVGILTILGAILQAAVFNDAVTAGLLFVHGIFYASVAYAMLTGLDDMRSVGNVSLTTCIVSAIYAVIYFSGTPLIAQSSYLGMASAGYAVLTFMVWLNANGKFPATTIAYSLILWTILGLWVPAFWLMARNALPF